jgi:hypothetical protein
MMGSLSKYNSIAIPYTNDVDLIVIRNSVQSDHLGLVTLGRETFEAAFGCF